jgi:peptidoglycan/xylan/chitin deacetylase (PgdA/CDA1 family)
MGRVRQLIHRGRLAFKRRYVARGLILIYHRVAEDPIDPWRLCVSPENFAHHMEILRKKGFKTVHVSELANSLRGRCVPPKTVAVTFDDGYRDNLDAARPILERYDTPATHFATAGYIGSDEPFWWDVLDAVFLRTEHLPESLDIALSGEQHRWTLGRDSVLEKRSDAQGAAWKPLGPSKTRRHEIHDSLWHLLVTALPAERERAVWHLIDWAELAPATWAQSRPMSENELRRLARNGLVEIGAHSLTHPALSAMPPALQAHELGASKARLEDVLGMEIRGCSYPQGQSSTNVQQLAREAGYDFACGSVASAVGSRSNLFHLPRVSVRDWTEARFTGLLDHYIAS